MKVVNSFKPCKTILQMTKPDINSVPKFILKFHHYPSSAIKISSRQWFMGKLMKRTVYKLRGISFLGLLPNFNNSRTDKWRSNYMKYWKGRNDIPQRPPLSVFPYFLPNSNNSSKDKINEWWFDYIKQFKVHITSLQNVLLVFPYFLPNFNNSSQDNQGRFC